MAQKLALKRLTASDLTFFEWHFTNHNAGNQKAINLNADVFIERLYPSLPELAQDRGERFPVDLYLYGPGIQGEYNVQRKIVKGKTYKNWRLNGEFVHNPPDDPDRFNILEPGDFAIMSLDGDLLPHAMRIFLVAANAETDSAIHSELSQLLGVGRRSMIAVTVTEIKQVIQQVNPPDNHPLHDLLLQQALEDAAQNGIEGITLLRSRASQRSVSHEALRRARDNAGRVGRIGEEFIHSYFVQQKKQGVIDRKSVV